MLLTDLSCSNVGDFGIVANINEFPPPHVEEDGKAIWSLPYIGCATLYPVKQSAAEFEGKVVAMESGKRDDEGRLYSVAAAECYAEEVGGMIEYLKNGEVKVWVKPEN